jgi:glycosyltransferase involved in cell wall biosynthesis
MTSSARTLPSSAREPVSQGEVPITAIVLTYNEEKNLGACLGSLAGWVDELFVVDSGSTDGTVAIATEHGARVVGHPFETHARQWAWALENLPCRHEWILGLDADQRVTADLRAEISRVFRDDAAGLRTLDGFYVKRRQMFRRRWIKHGGYYPKYLLKLVRRDRVRIDPDDLLDHHFYVRGPTGQLRHDLIEENRNEDEIAFWIEKHNRYAALLAREELRRRAGGRPAAIRPSPLGNPDQRALWRKRLWWRLPPYVRPCLYFAYRYVLRLGFLDGKEGFVFHVLQGFWFRLLVDIRLEEESRAREVPARESPGERR